MPYHIASRLSFPVDDLCNRSWLPWMIFALTRGMKPEILVSASATALKASIFDPCGAICAFETATSRSNIET